LFFVNGGTKLQEVPEIKNCIIGAAPNSLKRKRGGISKGKKYARKVEKPACGRQDAKKVSRVKPWRLGAFARALF
jgi:hypothetical protein